MNNSDNKKHGYKTDKIATYQQKRRQKAIEKYEATPKFCPQCGERIPFEKRTNKFCNSSCSAGYSNKRRPSISTKSRFCSCGNPKKLENKYCKECSDNHVYHKILRLEDAKHDRQRKRILLEQRGHCCENCKRTRWEGQPIPLELHHDDGNSDNNEPENLSIICPNCHALTANYKGANAGKNDSTRQKKRRKRYHDGKTF